MSDKKDPQNSKSDPFSQLTDMESTVRIDFGASQNVDPTSDGSSPVDFEKTLDGLMDIDDILKNDEAADHSSDEPTVSFSTDEIDFDELDAGINALSEELPENAKDQDEKLDDLDSILDDDSDDLFDTDKTVTLDAFDSDEEESSEVAASDSTFDEWPLLNEEDSDETPVADPLLDASGEFDMPDIATDNEEEEENKEEVPVIELTEEMLDEPDTVASDELDLPEKENTEQEHSKAEESSEESLDSISETPELTTTETNILAGATEAIHKIVEEEEEKKMHEAESIEEPVNQYPITSASTESKSGGSSSSLPAILALLGIAAGGFGAWMAWDATNRVADLESQIRNLQATKANTANKQSLADMQQRLTKVERRLTGTPTIEAAATLGEAPVESTSSTPTEAEITAAQKMSVVKSNKPIVKAITPATTMGQSQPSGDWVVNLSSHVKASAAAKEKARLIKAGLNAEVHSATIKNKVWYRVQVIGFSTKDEAKKQLRDIQERSGIKGAWIGKK